MKYNKYAFWLIFGICSIFIACESTNDQVINNDDTYYQEPHRPQYHFTPEYQWMNDPNGMVYYEGEYHLFYQHYPDSNVWGPMHWGHAVSEDLVSWEHLPIALYPDSLGYIFSGSAVVDNANTSGFGENGKPPLIAIFTYHDPVGEQQGTNIFQTQGIAYSNDKGRTWTKYKENPVIQNPGIRDFRDPKVFWHDATNQWCMIFAARDRVRIYNSPNLKNWTFVSEFGVDKGTHAGVWECPDLFELTVEGTSDKRWVMLVSINPGGPNGGSATQYFVGGFDGKTFTIDPDFEKALGVTNALVPIGEIFEDFENGYQNWKIEGTAFGNTPAQGALAQQNEVAGFDGDKLANSFLGGDASTGKLISTKFNIQKPFINLLVGGGGDVKTVGVRLVIDSKSQRMVSGANNEKLSWVSWDVSDLLGKEAYIEIYDQATGGWGHINVDQITFADGPAKSESEKAIWLDYGRDNYAGVTWSDIPQEDGRRLFIGWMSNWDYANVVPTETWRSAMTLSRKLSLHRTPQGLRVYSQPVEELKKNRLATHEFKVDNLEGQFVLNKEDLDVTQLEFEIEVNLPTVSQVAFGLLWSNDLGETYKLGYNANSQQFFSDRTNAGKKNFAEKFAAGVHYAPNLRADNKVILHGFIDVASAELFANDGSTVITDIFFPDKKFNKLSLYVENGMIAFDKVKVYGIKRTW